MTKGEQSGNVLVVSRSASTAMSILAGVMARPAGQPATPAELLDQAPKDFLGGLGQLVAMREAQRPPGSHTTSLFEGASAVSRRRWGGRGDRIGRRGAG